jgi:hypothetical protein
MADVNKEIALKVTTDVGQTTKQFGSATEELKKTQRALVDMALAGKQGTKEFREMETRAGQLRDAIGDVNRRVNQLASDTPKLQVLTSAAQGIAGGFAAAQGAAALFGSENEDVQQAILKTQGAMALLNGVQQVSNTLNKDSAVMMGLNTTATKAYGLAVGASTGALKLFRLALISTGIGAAVVAVGMLVANFDKVKAAVMGFIETSKPLQAILKFITESFTKLGRAIGIIPSESEAATRQMIEDLEKQQRLLEAAGANTFHIQKRLAELRLQLARQTGQGIAEAEEALVLLTAKSENEKYQKRKAAEEKTRAEREKAILAAREVDRKLLEDLNKSLIEMEAARERARQLQAENDEKAFQTRMQDEARRRLKEAELDERRAQIAIDTESQIQDAKYKVALSSFQTIADLSAFFAGKSEEAQEKAFNVQKTASIATTIIDTIVSASQAYKSLAAFPPFAILAAASATGAGLARIAAIRNTNFNRASTSITAGVRPAGMQTAGMPPPQGFNPNQSTPIVPPPQGQQINPAGQRVFVLERDITNVGKRVQSVERFATFGN